MQTDADNLRPQAPRGEAGGGNGPSPPLASQADRGSIIFSSAACGIRQPPHPTPPGERRSHAAHILLSSLTGEGRKTVKSKPERIKEVNKEIEGMGAKVLGQCAVLGPYDFVNVIEFLPP